MRVGYKLLAVLLHSAILSAQVTLPRVISSHMVVQRNLPVHVWGLADPGEQVTVSFRDETKSTLASPIGRWSLFLSPHEAGGPFVMTVQGNAQGEPPIRLEDILVGDVWVASGQSNMEFRLAEASTAARDLPHANIPQLRMLVVKQDAEEFPQDDMNTAGWTASSLATAKDFSATAWCFARDLEQREHVPIGVIESDWGGTPAEAWTRMTALGEDASLAPLFVSWGRMAEREKDVKLRDKVRAQLRTEGKSLPQIAWHPSVPQSWAPSALYNGMIAPLTPFPIRGVIWYQGESNTDSDRAPLYGRLFRTMITDWRKQWAIGDFPFLFVQLANYKATPDAQWATVREQQLQTLSLRNTAMAVTIDIGNPDNIHPTDKLDVGLRLSLAARALSYDEAIEYSGPLFRLAVPEGRFIRVWFTHAKGLAAKHGELTGFEVAGNDGVFVPATAELQGDSVTVSNSSVAAPMYVRYGWANNPQCNLYNGDALPASPFTTMQ